MSGAASCPGCHGAMQRRAFARKPMGEVEIDLCLGCQGIWFDQFESSQLTPGAVIALFRTIHESHGQGSRPLGARLPCPRCRKPLAITNDLQRNQRITYYRCADGHGRFSTFFQFLREKGFVRELTDAEIAKLRAVVAQVRCAAARRWTSRATRIVATAARRSRGRRSCSRRRARLPRCSGSSPPRSPPPIPSPTSSASPSTFSSMLPESRP